MPGLRDSSIFASDEWRSWRRNFRKFASLVATLSPTNNWLKLSGCSENDRMLTCGDGQKAKEDQPITMCTSHVVMYVADGHVNWPVLIVTGGDRHSSLVTAEDDRNEH